MSNRGHQSPRTVLFALLFALLTGIVAVTHVSLAKSEGTALPSELRAQPGYWPTPRIIDSSRPSGVFHTESLSLSLPRRYRDCTRIAFQSWVDGNWEIYVARGDGSQATRLTTNSVWDQAPSLREGCDLIAFSSQRSGNDNVYVMHADGSDVRQITFDTASDGLPALSPDGSKIAFQSNRDVGQSSIPELYVINTAGGTPLRLTHNSAYDGQADWSPDGKLIVFVSDRSGTSNIWIMDADGANPHQITSLPHAGGPKWSPDGAQIAFASDDLSTGFTGLWIVDADGANPHLVWRPTTPQTDAWPGGWSFDGLYILHEEATWVYDEDDDAWWLLTSYLDVINPKDTADRQRVLAVGINMAASWALCDVATPTSKVDPLPEMSTSPTTVRWTGWDDCSTQIEYHLQYHAGGTGSWIDWEINPGQTWTLESKGSFSWNDPGEMIYFRCRARDAIGQVEGWPSGKGDAYTSFPAHILGFVGDCRDVPVADAELGGPPPLEVISHSSVWGRYTLLAASEDDHTLTASAEGYQPVSLSRPGLDHMVDIDYALTTAPEFVQNGGFEAGRAGWYASGGASFTTSNYAYGNGLVRLANVPATAGMPWGLETTKTAMIWQSLEVPANSHQPTLSLMYVLGEGSDIPAGALQATIEDDHEEVIVMDVDGTTPWGSISEGTRYPLWQHAFADLTPWIGQMVTLTLRYDPGWTNSYALLDQISIASWLTPRVDAVSPNWALPGQAITVTIQGANFVGPTSPGGTTSAAPTTSAQVYLGSEALATTYVSDTVLQATIPADAPLGIYDVWVRNPSGHRSGLGGGFSVGRHLVIPLIHKDSSPHDGG